MRIPESCAECLYDRQRARCQDEEYLAQVKKLIEERGENDTSPLLVYRFNTEYVKRFGKTAGYADVKRHYNDLMLKLEDRFRIRIESSQDPVETALALARAANYIDFGAMNHVDEDTCLGLLEGAALRKDEREVFRHLMAECSDAQRFLLITDNCGEIVLDKLFLEQLKKRFPWLKLQVLVRGQEVLNDVTPEDAVYTGICRIAEIISNGKAIAGTVYDMLPDEARRALDRVDVIFAKGQGNYESLSGQGRHIYYTFLCKCDLFTSRFSVPPLTGMLVEE
jgi:uncharacterized protein with ATP-grasp and redox domains